MKTTCVLFLCVLVTHVWAECPAGCKCSRFYHLLRCREASLTDVPHVTQHMPVFHLDVSRNRISQLTNNSFSDSNLDDLKVLVMYRNNLTIVESDAFYGLSECLLYLDLSENPHIVLPATGFCLKTLDSLSLAACNLTSISAEFFTTMPGIAILHLQNNKLSVFDPKIIAPRSGLQLEELYLANNALTVLPLETVVSPIETLWIDGNPFHCGCDFHIAYSVLALVRHHSVQCYSPPRFHGLTGDELLAARLHCDVTTSELVEEDSWWDLHQWRVVSCAALVVAAAVVACLLYRWRKCPTLPWELRGAWSWSTPADDEPRKFSRLHESFDE